MVCIPIQVTEDQANTLRDLAARRGMRLEDLAREGVERILKENRREELWQRSLQLAGSFTDTASDVAENHDAYLEEAYSA
ncbi:MAG TPA: CopG family transcriptional regulator [Chloroflexota bacterium]|nr:CopG family transcriptional regulator [Chloroflexota bacterium]